VLNRVQNSVTGKGQVFMFIIELFTIFSMADLEEKANGVLKSLMKRFDPYRYKPP